MDLEKKVFEAIESAGIDREKVNFIYLFGSFLDDSEGAEDIDICVSLDLEEPEKAGYKIAGRVPDQIDLSIFENLPLQVKKEVFEGQLLYSRDDSVYDTAYQTLKDFENFKPLYRKAIGAEA